MEPQESREPLPARTTFLKLVVFTGVPYGLMMAAVFGVQAAMQNRLDPGGLALIAVAAAAFFGLAFSAAMLPLLREITIDVPVVDREAFAARLNPALKKAGYAEVDPVGSFWVSHPRWRGGFLAGSIRVGLDESTARLVGPTRALRKVAKAVRGD